MFGGYTNNSSGELFNHRQIVVLPLYKSALGVYSEVQYNRNERQKGAVDAHSKNCI